MPAFSDISCLHKFSNLNVWERTKHMKLWSMDPPVLDGVHEPSLWTWSMDTHFRIPGCFEKGKKRTTMPHLNRNILEILFFI